MGAGSFQARDNVAQFIAWAKSIGVPAHSLFESSDLVDAKDDRHLLYSLMEVARLQHGLRPPKLIEMEREIEHALEDPQERAGQQTIPYEPQLQHEVERIALASKFSPADCLQRDGLGRFYFGQAEPVFVCRLNDHLLVRLQDDWVTLQHFLQLLSRHRATVEQKAMLTAALSAGRAKPPYMPGTHQAAITRETMEREQQQAMQALKTQLELERQALADERLRRVAIDQAAEHQQTEARARQVQDHETMVRALQDAENRLQEERQRAFDERQALLQQQQATSEHLEQLSRERDDAQRLGLCSQPNLELQLRDRHTKAEHERQLREHAESQTEYVISELELARTTQWCRLQRLEEQMGTEQSLKREMSRRITETEQRLQDERYRTAALRSKQASAAQRSQQTLTKLEAERNVAEIQGSHRLLEAEKEIGHLRSQMEQQELAFAAEVRTAAQRLAESEHAHGRLQQQLAQEQYARDHATMAKVLSGRWTDSTLDRCPLQVSFDGSSTVHRSPVLNGFVSSPPPASNTSHITRLTAEHNNTYDNEIHLAFSTIAQERSTYERERDHNRTLRAELTQLTTYLDAANHERQRLEITNRTLQEDLTQTRRQAKISMGSAAMGSTAMGSAAMHSQIQCLQQEVQQLGETLAVERTQREQHHAGEASERTFSSQVLPEHPTFRLLQFAAEHTTNYIVVSTDNLSLVR